MLTIGPALGGAETRGVTIKGNTVKDSTNGLRIKTYADATDASVSDVVYDGNTLTGITEYGVVIEQGLFRPFFLFAPHPLFPLSPLVTGQR